MQAQGEVPTASSADVAPKPSPAEVARGVLDSRELKVYRPTNARFDPRAAMRALSDDPEFFEPSARELSSAATQMTNVVQQLNDAPLMTKKMRDAETARKMSRFSKVLIRVLLPDRSSIQGIFKPQSTVREVVRFVNAALLDARNVTFHLFVVPPKTKLLKMDATLWSEGLVPAALVHLGIDVGPTETPALLKPYVLSLVEDAPQPVPLPAPAPPPSSAQGASSKAPTQKSSKGAKKTPRWFKTKK